MAIPVPTADQVVARTLARCQRVGDCLIFPSTCRKGYSQIKVPIGGGRVKTVQGHRFVYEAIVGPIPAGLVIDHTCRNRACLETRHHEPVSNRENILRGVSRMADRAAQTTCVRGHLFSQENTYIRPSRPHSRECITCRRAWDRK